MKEHILRFLTGAFWIVVSVLVIFGLSHDFEHTMTILVGIAACYLLGWAIRS